MRSRSLRALLFLVPLGLVLGLAGGATYASFSAATFNGNSITADPDWTAPLASGSVIAGVGNPTPGYIHQGGDYYVYAAVTDSGNPPSGVASVTADVSRITTGQTAAPLTAGSWTVGGVAYDYRSALLTADASLVPGAKPYSLTMSDVRLNSTTQGGFVVTVDNSAPAGSDIQTANNAFVVGYAETGDRIIYTFTETMDSQTIMAGWDGTATTVTVRLLDNFGGRDSIQVYDGANTTLLNLGAVNLGGNQYVKKGTAVFSDSTMVQSGSSIVITLGVPSGGELQTVGTATTMVWTPSALATDPAGNPCSTADVTESGGADVEF
ncbi:MAG TPA: hypothetical protein VF382_07435 [Actinomycetota bacterium]